MATSVPAKNTTKSTTNPQQKALKRFISLMGQFLGGMKVVFPHCLQLKKVCLQFEIAMGIPADTKPFPRKKLIRFWHKSMSPFYERCTRKDASVWKEISEDPESYVAKLDLWSKWNDTELSDSNKETIWSYIIPMNKFSNKYSALEKADCPTQTAGADAATEGSRSVPLSTCTLPAPSPSTALVESPQSQKSTQNVGGVEDTVSSMLGKESLNMFNEMTPVFNNIVQKMQEKYGGATDRDDNEAHNPDTFSKKLDESFKVLEECIENQSQHSKKNKKGLNFVDMLKFVTQNKEMMSNLKTMSAQFLQNAKSKST